MFGLSVQHNDDNVIEAIYIAGNLLKSEKKLESLVTSQRAHISYYQYQPLKANKKTLSFKYIQVLFYVCLYKGFRLYFSSIQFSYYFTLYFSSPIIHKLPHNHISATKTHGNP
jgi:hypothetical protein